GTADEHKGSKHSDRLGHLLDDGDDARAVVGEVDGWPSDLRDLLDEVVVAGVDRVSRAELAGHLETVVVHVGGGDRRGARVRRWHDRGEADRPGAHDEHRVAEPGPRFIQRGAGARAEAAREWPHQLDGGVAWHLDQRIRLRQRIGGERRLAEEVTTDRLAIAAVRTRARLLALEASP